jgi:hypothetical protein
MVALWWYFDVNCLFTPWYHSLGQPFNGIVSPQSQLPTSQCSTISFQDLFFGLEVLSEWVTGTRGITRPGVGSFCWEMDTVAGTQGHCGVLEVDRATVGIGMTTGLCESSCWTVPTGGGVVVGEAGSETLVKQWLESRCWRAIAVVQAACTTTLVKERISLHRPLTSAATDACTMQSSSVEAGLVSTCSPAREASVSQEMGERASL